MLFDLFVGNGDAVAKLGLNSDNILQWRRELSSNESQKSEACYGEKEGTHVCGRKEVMDESTGLEQVE